MKYKVIVAEDTKTLSETGYTLTPLYKRGNINTCYGLARRVVDMVRNEMEANNEEDEDE